MAYSKINLRIKLVLIAVILNSCTFFSVKIPEPKYQSEALVKLYRANHKEMLETQKERMKYFRDSRKDLDNTYIPPAGFYDPAADNPSIYPEYYPIGVPQIYYDPVNGNNVIKNTIRIYDPYPEDNDSQYTMPKSYRYPSPDADNPINPHTEILFD